MSDADTGPSRATRSNDASSGPPLVVRLGVPALIAGGLLLVLSQQSAQSPTGTPPAPATRVATSSDATQRPVIREGMPATATSAPPSSAATPQPVFRDPRALVQPVAVDGKPTTETPRPAPAATGDGTAATATAPASGPAKAPAPSSPASAPATARPEPRSAPPVPEPPRPAVVAAANVPTVPPPAAAPCIAPDILVTPLAAGRMHVRIASPCREGQDVRIAYGGVDLVRTIASDGRLDLELDLFAGDRRSADVHFADGTRRIIPTLAHDLDRLSKVAVTWRAAADLDLHVWEPAGDGAAVHLSPEQPSAPRAALDAVEAGGRGRGFIGTSDDGKGVGDKLEVYTFLHGTADALAGAQGGVRLALDHATRGSTPAAETCGEGPLARIEFSLVLLSPTRDVTRAGGTLAPMPCGRELDPKDRFDASLMPVVRLRAP